MINLQNLGTNGNIIIYVNTLDADIPFDSNLFLFGFKSGFGNQWFYVIPNIVIQNSRYTKFSIELVNIVDEDPENGMVALYPAGNFDYKLWAIEDITLDPSNGYILDKGQAYVEPCANEVDTVVYISDNEAEKNIVYVDVQCGECIKWSTTPDKWNLAVQLWDACN
jgi:hypothetical protein